MDWIELGYIGLFLGTLLAATIVPFSSEFILTGLLIAGFDPLACFLFATSGNSIGSIITYFMGRYIPFEKALKKLKISEIRIQKSKKFFHKYGLGLALFSWIPIFGDAFVFLMGTYQTKIFPTFLFITFGKALRFAIVIFVYLFFQ